MTAVHIGDVPPALDNPEPSATKIGRRWGESVDWTEVEATLPDGSDEGSVDGLDHARWDRAFGPDTAYMPRPQTATFRVPYGMRQSTFENHARDMATRWFDEMRRRGFDLASGTYLDVRPGPNPSQDLATGLSVPGYRDYLLTALFVERRPEVIRLELPGELFDPIGLRQLPTSSGDDEGD